MSRVFFMSKELLKIGVRTIQLGCACHVFMANIFDMRGCAGPSMLPTLRVVADTLVSEKLSVRFGTLDIGDLVVFISPRDPTVVACKRIIGMPGDTICVDPLSPPDTRTYMKVPPGHIWVQGDNASNSTDSRIYGPLPLGLVKSRVLLRAYPNFKSFRNNIGLFEARSPSEKIYNPDDVIREVTLEYLKGELPVNR